MTAVTDETQTQREALLIELDDLQRQFHEATGEQRKLESRSATPGLLNRDRQAQWTLCQLRRAAIGRKIQIARGKLAILNKPAADAKNVWRSAMTKRIDEQLAWREVLKVSLLTHRSEHLSVWGNDLGKQTERIKAAEKRLRDCDEEIQALQSQLAASSPEVSA